MTIHTPVPTDGSSRDLIAEATYLFDCAADEVMKLIAVIETEKAAEGAAEVPPKLKVLREALRLAITEKQNAARLRGDAGRLAGGRALDLDQARDEIGRRLACLRDAGAG